MKISIIGTGRIGRTLAQQLDQHEIFLGSRAADNGRHVAAELGVQGGSIVEAAQWCDVCIFAFPWFAFTDVERAVGDLLDGKIIIDPINPLRSSGSLALGHQWSAGEEVAKRFHRSAVVKAFNHVYYTHFADPVFNGRAATALYCSNDDKAKAVAAQLASEMGFAPVDAGPIKNARLLEPFAVLWMQLAFLTQHDVEIAFELIGRNR
jgi:predicted dinucleotide-binding enzyme